LKSSVSDIQNLALKLLDTTDKVCNRRLKNPVARTFWNKIGKSHAVKNIMESTDEELKVDMNELYNDFKDFFENKQMKDLLDEGNSLSQMDLKKLLPTNQKIKEVSKYF
tara:strand:- start:96 stop:422 length:327 start_codon:yes stop_codon:yes gene_type:complete